MALRACYYPCSRQNLHKKLKNLKAIELEAGPKNIIDIDSITVKQSISSMSSMSNTDSFVKSELRTDISWWNEYIARDDSMATSGSTIDLTKNDLAKNAPQSIDISSTAGITSSTKSNHKKRRRSSIEVNRSRVEKKRTKDEYMTRYNKALVAGAEQWIESLEITKERQDSSKYGYKCANSETPKSCSEICNEVNMRFKMEDQKKVTKTTLQRYVRLGLKSAPKLGAKPSLPIALLNAVRLHIKMKQLSRSSQATPIEIKAAMMASVKDTRHEGTFNVEYAWHRLRELYPEEIAPSNTSTTENIRSEWTTYTKLDDWFTVHKPILLKSGLAIDKPMVSPDGSTAEVTVPEDCARRIINFDETEHPFSTQCDRGGSRSKSYGDPNLPPGSTRGTRGARHTTGIYATSAAGEVNIFDTKSQQIDNFKLKPKWTSGLPTVRDLYGCPTTEEYPSNVCVKKSGCTNEELFSNSYH